MKYFLKQYKNAFMMSIVNKIEASNGGGENLKNIVDKINQLKEDGLTPEEKKEIKDTIENYLGESVGEERRKKLEEIINKIVQNITGEVKNKLLELISSFEKTGKNPELNYENENLTESERRKIIEEKVKNGEGNIDLLILGVSSERLKDAKDKLKIGILAKLNSEKIKKLDLSEKELDNIVLGITNKLLLSGLDKTVGDVFSTIQNGVTTIGEKFSDVEGVVKNGAENVVDGVDNGLENVTGIFDRFEDSFKKFSPKDMFSEEKISGLIDSSMKPLISLLEKTKNKKEIEGFLQNPKAIENYREGDNIQNIKKIDENDLVDYILKGNKEVLKLDEKLGGFEEIQVKTISMLSKMPDFIQNAAKDFLNFFLELPIIGDIIASLLGYDSAKEAKEGIDKDLKEAKATNILKSLSGKVGKNGNIETNNKGIGILKDKDLKELNYKKLEGFYKMCKKENININQDGFWNGIFEGKTEKGVVINDKNNKLLKIYNLLKENNSLTKIDKSNSKETSKILAKELNKISLDKKIDKENNNKSNSKETSKTKNGEGKKIENKEEKKLSEINEKIGDISIVLAISSANFIKKESELKINKSFQENIDTSGLDTEDMKSFRAIKVEDFIGKNWEKVVKEAVVGTFEGFWDSALEKFGKDFQNDFEEQKTNFEKLRKFILENKKELAGKNTIGEVLDHIATNDFKKKQEEKVKKLNEEKRQLEQKIQKEKLEKKLKEDIINAINGLKNNEEIKEIKIQDKLIKIDGKTLTIIKGDKINKFKIFVSSELGELNIKLTKKTDKIEVKAQIFNEDLPKGKGKKEIKIETFQNILLDLISGKSYTKTFDNGEFKIEKIK